MKKRFYPLGRYEKYFGTDIKNILEEGDIQ